MEQTTQDGVSVSELDATVSTLETLRDAFSDDGMSNLSEILNEAHHLVEKYEETARWSNEYDLPEVGDILVDTESNPRFGDGRVEVVEVLGDKEAQRHYIDVDYGKQSVAYKNPGHPGDAPVIKARYVDGSDKVYSFPVTRLED